MTNQKDKAVLFIGANRPVVGREQEAMSFWMETLGWLDSQERMGWFTHWDGCWLTAHGGEMNTCVMCWGDRAKLDEWRRTDGFEAWVFRAMNCMEGVGVVPGVSFAAAKETLERRSKALGSR